MEYEYKSKYKPLDLSENREKSFVDVNCPSCNTQVSVQDLNLDKEIGKCNNCNVLFSISEPIIELKKMSLTEDEVQRPEGVDIVEINDELEISLSQPYSNLYLIYASFGYMPIIGTIKEYVETGNSKIALFIAFFSFIWLYTVYKLILYKSDKVYITINHDEVIVVNRPKNFRSDKTYKSDEVDQLYVKKNTDGLALYIILNGADGQKHEKVLGRFKEISKAKYIEQEIEKYLEIKNRKVAGEL